MGSASKAGEKAPGQPGQRPHLQTPQQQRASQQPLASGPTLSYPLPKNLDLAHLHVVITGGTSGIGLEAATGGLGLVVRRRRPRGRSGGGVAVI